MFREGILIRKGRARETHASLSTAASQRVYPGSSLDKYARSLYITPASPAWDTCIYCSSIRDARRCGHFFSCCCLFVFCMRNCQEIFSRRWCVNGVGVHHIHTRCLTLKVGKIWTMYHAMNGVVGYTCCQHLFVIFGPYLLLRGMFLLLGSICMSRCIGWFPSTSS